MLGLLPSFWLRDNCPHADAEVQLMLADAAAIAAAEGGGSRAILARVPAHRVVLAGASPYFHALLSPTWQSDSNAAGSAPVVRLQVDDAGTAAGLLALLRCIYTGDIQLPAADVAAVLSTADAGTAAAAAEVRHQLLEAARSASTNTSGWQQLHVRVVALADQFAVPGVLEVAVSKLTALFSFKLDWPAVEAVLWMPSALAHQPRLAKLRSMALTHIIQQGARELDAFLASPRGRHTLQAMPADAVAALLASDDLALASEDSILTAIEVWLAGPVAATTTAGATAGTSAQGVVQQLVAAVRLPLCSGGFLAAAVQRLPWLCGGLTAQQLADAAVLQRYYSATMDGRYQLAMELLGASRACPWSVPMRRGMPAVAAAAHSGLQSAAATARSGSARNREQGTCTRLSSIRRLLCGAGASAPAAASGAEVLLRQVFHSGYLWRVSLTAARVPAAAGDARAAAMSTGAKQLRLLIQCRPAGAADLVQVTAGAADSSSSSSSVSMDVASCAAPVCSFRPAAACGTAQDGSGSNAACGCAAVAAIAAAKTAAAVARHSPYTAAPLTVAADSGVASSGRGVCHPRAVVVGVRLAAAPTAAQLQQLVSRGDAEHPGSSHTAWLLPWCDAAGACEGLLPIAIDGVNSGSTNLVSKQHAVTGAEPDSAVQQQAWDTARWTGIAPTGELHWLCRMRLLSD